MRAKVWVVAVVAVGLIAAGCGSGGGTSSAADDPATTASTTAKRVIYRKCSSYKGVKPQTCISHTGFLCNGYTIDMRPKDCFTAAQNRARAKVAKAKAAAAAKARAKAAARAKEARAKAAARARARAAAIAAANAWHRGYTQQDGNIYWKWIKGSSCEDYATNGCWHVGVITRDGCPSYVAVHANEYAGKAIINELLDNQGYGIPAKTARIFELDADQAGVTAGDVQIDCS
jgi:hypothetical protein